MGKINNAAKSARSLKPKKAGKTNLVDVLVSSNEKELRVLGRHIHEVKRVAVKAAVKAAAEVVSSRAKANVAAIGPHETYTDGTPGDSRKTRTRDKWSSKVRSERDGGSHDDLSQSITYKVLPISKSKPVVSIVGPDWHKFRLGHLIEFGGTTDYKKPSAHFLWGYDQPNDIAKIKARPFLEPAAHQTLKLQQRVFVGEIKKRVPKT